jgi:hypothetical protein
MGWIQTPRQASQFLANAAVGPARSCCLLRVGYSRHREASGAPDSMARSVFWPACDPKRPLARLLMHERPS